MSDVLNPACVAPGCDRPRYRRCLCSTHYQRHRKYGRLTLPTVEDRFFGKVYASDDGCWIWTAYLNEAGYGQFGDQGRVHLAHRWAWVHLRGDLPPDLTLDHLCRTPSCVNPWHMEPVSLAENIRRAATVRNYGPPMTVCGNGHPLNKENAYQRPGRRNSLACRACMREYQRNYAARRRSA